MPQSQHCYPRIINGAPSFIRRGRGFVPKAIKLAQEIPPTLAVGGHLKNTVCITRNDEAFISQHIGDIDNSATIHFFEESVQHLLDMLDVKPQRIAHDLHPDFYSSQFARRFANDIGATAIAVQHHHAHLAALAAEHKILHPIIGLALDGFGLGENNQAWGGELMRLEGCNYQHLGSLAPLKQPGGDKAAREPWRMAAAAYQMLGRGNEIASLFPEQANANQLALMMSKELNSPETSSAGRLFDAAAGILKIQTVSSFEGQAPMLLEGLVTQPKVLNDGWSIKDGRLCLTPLLQALTCCEAVEGANLFHGTLIVALSDWVTQAAKQHKINKVVLGGGCFLNHVLSSGLVTELKRRNLTPKLAQQVPVNDGGISLGQAWVAGLS
ncbi:carbamoyltransferase HypF [Pseudomonadota bacterium]